MVVKYVSRNGVKFAYDNIFAMYALAALNYKVTMLTLWLQLKGYQHVNMSDITRNDKNGWYGPSLKIDFQQKLTITEYGEFSMLTCYQQSWMSAITRIAAFQAQHTKGMSTMNHQSKILHSAGIVCSFVDST